MEAIYEHWRLHGAKQQEDQFSDGTLRLIGLLWALFENNSLLLLEQPELSLHSGIVGKLPSLFYKVLQNNQKQILLSTHSADLLSDKGISGDETLLFVPMEEGTKVQTASSISRMRDLLKHGLSIADVAIPFTTPANIARTELLK